MVRHSLLLLILAVLLSGCNFQKRDSIEYLVSRADLVAVVKITGQGKAPLGSSHALVIKSLKGKTASGEKIIISGWPSYDNIGYEYLVFLKASGNRFELVNENAAEWIFDGHISPIGREPVKDKDGWVKLVKLEEVISEIEAALKDDKQP